MNHKGAQGNVSEYWICSIFWLWWWLWVTIYCSIHFEHVQFVMCQLDFSFLKKQKSKNWFFLKKRNNPDEVHIIPKWRNMLGTILSSNSKIWEPRQSSEVCVRTKLRTTQPIVPLEVWQRSTRLRNVPSILGCQKGQKGQPQCLSLQSQVSPSETEKFGFLFLFFFSTRAAYILWAPKSQHGLKWTFPVSKLMTPFIGQCEDWYISTNTQPIQTLTSPWNPTPNTSSFTSLILDIAFPLANDQCGSPFGTLTHSSAGFLYLECTLE